MNSGKFNKKTIPKKKWTHIPFEKNDLSEIGLFFKELYFGVGDYGNMGFSHWKIVTQEFNTQQ